MKNVIFSIIGVLLLCGILSCGREKAQNQLSQENSITVFTTPELFKLTTKWADEFSGLNPDVNINVINVAESNIHEYLDISSNLGFMSGDYDTEMFTESLWKEVIGRDVIVPVFNSNNPFVAEICRQGISPEEFAQIINDPGMMNWGTLLNTREKAPVNLYMIDDASIKSGMAKLLNVNQIKIDGINVEDIEELISSVQNDKYSIGICKITDVADMSDQSILESIKLLPIDRNDNGKIDYMENIYDDMTVLSRGVEIGKYPKALSNNIYSVSPIKPSSKTELAFLKWVLTDGQQFLDNYGYSDLLVNERLAKVNLLDNYKTDITLENNATSREPLFFYTYFPIILTVVLGLVILVISGVLKSKNRLADIPEMISVTGLVFNEDFVESPPGLYYDKTHTWAYMEKDGLVKIGIDDFLQHITGPITNIKMKYPGEKIRKGKQVLSLVQNGKQLDIYASVSGTIKEQNKALATNTSIINSSPFAEGWIYKIEPTNWLKEIQFLIMGNKYREWLKCEFSRLKEFLTVSLGAETAEHDHVLQDGGELKDGILKNLGPKVWEDFQVNFIDVSS